MTTEAPTALPGDACPNAESLAAYVEGGVTPEERTRIEMHLTDCADCRDIVGDAVRVSSTASNSVPSFRDRKISRRLTLGIGGACLATAAALLIIVRVSRQGPESSKYYVSEMADLVRTVGTARSVEPRLTGGFAHGLVPDVTRAARRAPPDLSVLGAAESVRKAGERRGDAPGFAATGVADLVSGNAARAVEELERAAARSGRGDIQSDLSAALLALARERGGDPQYLRRARAAAEQAAKRSPELREAWFNRALASETTDSPDAAVRAWQDYLERETDFAWQAEAKRHIAKIQDADDDVRKGHKK